VLAILNTEEPQRGLINDRSLGDADFGGIVTASPTFDFGRQLWSKTYRSGEASPVVDDRQLTGCSIRLSKKPQEATFAY